MNTQVKEIDFKGQVGVLMENETYQAIILPGMGGKIASFYHKHKDFELIFQNKEAVYGNPSIYSNFAEFDASGFDDCFPTIDECLVEVGNESYRFPDHGEIWSGKFDYYIRDGFLEMTFRSPLFHYSYYKQVSLGRDGLVLKYRIQNAEEGKEIPVLWAFHGLVNCKEEMEIIFPKGTNRVRNVKDSDYLGKAGKLHDYPTTHDEFGNEYFLNRVFPKSTNKTEKYYVEGRVSEGLCGMYFPKENILYRITYDKEKLPFLGFWITEGGFRGDYNCALEPCNGFYDDVNLALKNESYFYLRDNMEFKIELSMTEGRV